MLEHGTRAYHQRRAEYRGDLRCTFVNASERIRVPQPWPAHWPSEVGKKKRRGWGGLYLLHCILLAPPMSLHLRSELVSALDVDLRSRYKTTLDSVVSGTASYGKIHDLGN